MSTLALLAIAAMSPNALDGQEGYEYRSLNLSRKGYYESTARYFSTNQTGLRGASASRSLVMAKAAQTEFFQQARGAFESLGRPTAPWTSDWKATVTAFAPELCSFMVEIREYTGGAHANTNLVGTTMGVVAGQAVNLKWSHVADPSHDAIVKHLIADVVRAKKARMGDSEEQVVIPDLGLDNFVASPYGIAWLFGQGVMGSEAEGPTIAKISWQELAPALKGESPVTRYVSRNTILSDWEFVEFQSMDDTVERVPQGLFTLRIGLDGTMSGRVDVNRFSGAARVRGSELKLTVGATTRAMPLPGSYHDRYLKNLTDVRSAVLKGDELFLALKVDAGIMRFRRINPGP